MPNLDLIHLGDIHYPEYWEAVDLDQKDDAAPVGVVARATRHMLEEVLREALRVRDRCNQATVVVSGDLTTRAQMDAYGLCVDWLAATFQLPAAADRFHVVPGNHDVVRGLANAEDLMAKFEPAAAAWEAAASRDVLAVDKERFTVMTDGPASIVIISMNSCVGSGEHRHLPAKVRSQLATVIAEFDAAAEDSFGKVYEQLDTPAFLEAHLSARLP